MGIAMVTPGFEFFSSSLLTTILLYYIYKTIHSGCCQVFVAWHHPCLLQITAYLCPNTFFKNKFIYLFLAVLGLCCCTWAFSSCRERGILFVAVHELLIAVASLAAEHGL